MFGYIRAMTPQLRVIENEYYRAAYCGLCRAMGACTGQCSRFALSYDMTFFALLRIALRGESPSFGQKGCIAHPFRRWNYMKRNADLDLCAAVSALLTYYKCVDDRTDERGSRRLKAVLAMPFAKRMRRKAKRLVAEADTIIADGMEALAQLEKECVPSVDRPAGVFGDMMGKLFSIGLDRDRARIAYCMGLHYGRWLYILDAADDLQEDIRRDRYNPYRYLVPGGVLLPTSTVDVLIGELAAAEPALDLIGWQGQDVLHELILNIVYLGLPAQARYVLYDEEPDSDYFGAVNHRKQRKRKKEQKERRRAARKEQKTEKSRTGEREDAQ